MRTRDRRDGAVPEKYKVVKAIKVFNGRSYKGYSSRLHVIESECEVGDATHRSHSPPDLLTQLPGEKLAVALDVPPLHTGGLEAFLFHGTKPAGARGIALEDFDLKFARDGLFGRGIYFAESCSKSDEYTAEDKDGARPLLLCRVTLGRMKYCDERNPDKRELENACTSGGFHSVLGDRRKVHNTYREFILYDPLQAYTHFVIWYKRL